jgi:hypothetical protein
MQLTRWLSFTTPCLLSLVLGACGPVPEGDELEIDQDSAEIKVSTGCVPAADQAAVFEKTNFGGKCAVLDVGSYAGSGSSGFGLGNDVISSVIVGNKVVLTLFEKTKAGGATVKLRGSNGALGAFNDKASSARLDCDFPTRAPTPAALPPSRAPVPVLDPPSRAPTPVLDPPSRAPRPVPGVCG